MFYLHPTPHTPVNLLDTVKSFLESEVAPNANDIDSNPSALFRALRGLGNLDLLALRVPRSWGGREVSEVTFGDFQELIARYSGTLAFLQTQHQSAASMLVASSNIDLHSEYLPRLGSGEVLLGVGFSQLRREGKPLAVAVAVEGGYRLNGVVPWVTGWGIFHEFIVAAVLPDGSAVFGVVPFGEEEDKPQRQVGQVGGGTEGNIGFGEVGRLAAMSATNTVTAELNWFLPHENVVFVKPPGWIHVQDKINVLKSTFLVTGCALAGLDIIEGEARRKNLPFIYDAWVSLQDELDDCRCRIRAALVDGSIDFQRKLYLRAWAIDLATRIAHAAVTVSSGAANYMHNNAQRVYREALVFTVTGQTRDVMAATLKRLTQGSMINMPDRQEPDRQDAYPTVMPARQNHIVHLSHVIDIDIPQWQGDPNVKFTTVAQRETHGYFLRELVIGEHSATHINAPISFDANGVGIDEYVAESLIAPSVVIDISAQAAMNPDYVLTVKDILVWEQQYGKITEGNVVLLHTGWSAKWSDTDAFMLQDDQGIHFPGFGSDATQFLLENRKIAGIGIDTHGVDGGIDTTFAVNRLVLEKPRIVLENLTNLDKLPARGFKIAVAPLLLRGGSGSPVGVLAIVETQGNI
jgi:kynurenine formamidase/alkylation response protein AidB-like acyl-CoA dehydrogenase